MLIAEVARALAGAGVEYGIAGGFAVALHGAVRGTLYVDVVLALGKANYEAAEHALLEMGFAARLPIKASDVFDNRDRYIREQNLIAWSFSDPEDPSRIVDLLILWDKPSVPVVMKSIQGISVAVLDKQSLIQMKRESGRPQDLEDVRALERLR